MTKWKPSANEYATILFEAKKYVNQLKEADLCHSEQEAKIEQEAFVETYIEMRPSYGNKPLMNFDRLEPEFFKRLELKITVMKIDAGIDMPLIGVGKI